ncbi:NUDIX hydrolase [Leeuwenhoekiella marinoflava]|uniref:ADP-ribose pyrophosphatase YjhB (NUDIX family) n=2 Tax=Leeuwenhoekiella marinoflava TaxID=988 RepID=A0A4Q0PKG0_9FLAO|nr:NUDIX domain-containing protein [Leeuwenhoekiella marinoflava]RXG28433.1 ADP-ribose pyrophosphatase YjhB (NUDIX family) [Leeuwenhoekiella marinoflava]SHF51751.1 ADP-ribose pyrophosphatase YjhB, NUDIX family [Leeuwenhoekiella marinoflava DSM 3653]
MNIPSPAEKAAILESITIDCVIFGFRAGNLEVLLVRHGEGISKDKWGLPGGWIYNTESTDDAANRLLLELTGIKDIYLEQLRAFSDPDRFPLSRVITVGYYALIKEEDYDLKAGATASEVAWFKVSEVKDLIYDHAQILEIGLRRLRRRIKQEPIGFNLLPQKFTLLQLMHLYEEILGKEMDKPNFRRKILKMNLLTPLNEKQKDVSHRAAKLYQFNPETYQQLQEKGFNFEF